MQPAILRDDLLSSLPFPAHYLPFPAIVLSVKGEHVLCMSQALFSGVSSLGWAPKRIDWEHYQSQKDAFTLRSFSLYHQDRENEQ